MLTNPDFTHLNHLIEAQFKTLKKTKYLLRFNSTQPGNEIELLQSQKAGLNLVLDAINENNYQQAIIYCEKLQQFDDKNAVYYLLHAVCLTVSNQDEQAKTIYARVHELNPTLSKDYTDKSAALNEKADYGTAMTMAKLAILVDPTNADALYHLSDSYERLNQYDEVIKLHQEIIKLNPHHARAFNLLGLVLENQNKRDEAITAYQSAIQWGDQRLVASAWHNLGDCYREMSNHKEAATAFEKAIAIGEQHNKPVEALGYRMRGLTYQADGQVEPAISAFKKAIELSRLYHEPTNEAWAYINLGELYRQQKQFDKAIKAFKKATSIEHAEAKITFIKATINLGDIYEEQGKDDDAITAYDSAIAKAKGFDNAKLANAYNNKAVTLEKKDRNKAIKYYKKAITVAESCSQSSLALYYKNLGLAYRGSNDFSTAIETLNKAMELAKIHDQELVAIIYFNLGKTYYLQKNLQEAETHFKQAIQLSDELSNVKRDALYGLCKIYKKQQNFELALATFNQFDELTPVKSKQSAAQVYYLQGKIYLGLNDQAKAKDSFETAITNGITDNKVIAASAYYQLGLIHHNQGNDRLAEENYKKSLVIAKTDNRDLIPTLVDKLKRIRNQASTQPQPVPPMPINRPTTNNSQTVHGLPINLVQTINLLVQHKNFTQARTLLDDNLRMYPNNAYLLKMQRHPALAQSQNVPPTPPQPSATSSTRKRKNDESAPSDHPQKKTKTQHNETAVPLGSTSPQQGVSQASASGHARHRNGLFTDSAEVTVVPPFHIAHQGTTTIVKQESKDDEARPNSPSM